MCIRDRYRGVHEGEGFCSPCRQLCPVLIETTQRGEALSEDREECVQEKFPLSNHNCDTKKSKKYKAPGVNELKRGKDNTAIGNKENNRIHAKNNHSKNQARRPCALAKKGRSKSTGKFANRGKFTQEEAMKLWKLVQKHAKKYTALAADLKREGFIS
eukprot:TRINITY_DN15392_c0_g1_i3.p1 TRINITY_DN15392_c0_g1~~TRINITY_DN15392_c0_g1_i3.p1  ORF type:complete len:173 (-),score=28.24 TRINITY_DN15392_c0_g1_i3:140-613(-)